MNKRIVVGLDGSQFSKTAVEFACLQAKTSDGTVIGIGVIDLPGIESVERGTPLGALYFAEKAEEHKLKDASEKIQQFLGDCEETCKKLAVEYEVRSEQGVPADVIVEAGKTADLIVLGLRTFFHFETSSKPGDTLKQVLEHSICPVFAVPEAMETVKNVLITYDGSIQSAKAMRAFVSRFYTSMKETNISLLTTIEGHTDTEEIQNEAAKYLKCWDIEPTMILEEGEAKENIYRHAKELGNCLVVMGAHGRSTIAKFFFGSTTRRLIEDGTIPLMVYH